MNVVGKFNFFSVFFMGLKVLTSTLNIIHAQAHNFIIVGFTKEIINFDVYLCLRVVRYCSVYLNTFILMRLHSAI